MRVSGCLWPDDEGYCLQGPMGGLCGEAFYGRCGDSYPHSHLSCLTAQHPSELVGDDLDIHSIGGRLLEGSTCLQCE